MARLFVSNNNQSVSVWDLTPPSSDFSGTGDALTLDGDGGAVLARHVSLSLPTAINHCTCGPCWERP